jgi:hypothetical protein
MSNDPKNSAQCLLHLFPNSEPLKDWVVSDNGGEITISDWNTELGKQPTTDELNSVSQEAKITAKFKILRKKRNRLLTETDWWASSDLNMTAAQKKYRQDLRDLPSTVSRKLDENGNLQNIIWPDKPN